MCGVFGLDGLEDAGQLRAFGRDIKGGGVVGQTLRAHEGVVGQRGIVGQLPELAGAADAQQGENHPEDRQRGENKIQDGCCCVGFHKR